MDERRIHRTPRAEQNQLPVILFSSPLSDDRCDPASCESERRGSLAKEVLLAEKRGTRGRRELKKQAAGHDHQPDESWCCISCPRAVRAAKEPEQRETRNEFVTSAHVSALCRLCRICNYDGRREECARVCLTRELGNAQNMHSPTVNKARDRWLLYSPLCSPSPLICCFRSQAVKKREWAHEPQEGRERFFLENRPESQCAREAGRPDTCAGDLLKGRQTSKAHRFSRTHSSRVQMVFCLSRHEPRKIPCSSSTCSHTGCNRLLLLSSVSNDRIKRMNGECDREGHTEREKASEPTRRRPVLLVAREHTDIRVLHDGWHETRIK